MMQTSMGRGEQMIGMIKELKPSNSIAMSGMAVICFLQNCELDLATKRGLALENGVEYLSKVSISKVNPREILCASYFCPCGSYGLSKNEKRRYS